MEQLEADSMVVAEFGRTNTRVVLVDRIDDEFRFVGRGEAAATQEPPYASLTSGLQMALQQVEQVSGRRLLRRDQPLQPQAVNGDGVDTFVAIANVGDPWRLAILDLGAQKAEVTAIAESTRRLEVLIYTITPALRGLKPPDWIAKHVTALEIWRPGSLLIVTGQSPNAESLARIIGLVEGIAGPEAVTPSQRADARNQLPVLVIGTDAAYEQIAAKLASRTRLQRLKEATPVMAAEKLASELVTMAADRASRMVSGFDAVASWSAAPVVSRQRAQSLVAQFLARSLNRRVALVDVEEALGLYVSSPERGTAAVVADVDLSVALPNLLAQVTPPVVRRWLPFDYTEIELLHWALNHALRSLTIPVAIRDQLLEQAFAREAIRLTESRLVNPIGASIELIVGSPWLARWNSPAAAAMVLLDGLLPTPSSGMVTLALDQASLLPAMGALAQVQASAAASVLENDSLVSLGTCVVVQGADGQRLASGTYEPANGSPQSFEVRGGTIHILPCGPDDSATLRLTLEKGAAVGQFKQGQTLELRSPDQLAGGAVGIIIDARGRPLALPDDPRRHLDRLRDWLSAAGVLPATDVGR